MQELNARQEKELLEIEGLCEAFVAKWETMREQKNEAVFRILHT